MDCTPEKSQVDHLELTPTSRRSLYNSPSRLGNTPKRSRYFSPSRLDTIQKKVCTEVDRAKNILTSCDLNDIQKEENVLLILVAKLGFSALQTLISAVNQIPKQFYHRTLYIAQILKECGKSVSVADCELYIDILTSCTTVTAVGSTEKNVLWPSFLVCQLETCIVDGCDGRLFGEKSDTTSCTLFTLSGPVPAIKSVLKCRNCGIRYGIDKYHLPNGSSKFYPDGYNQKFVSASNKVYFDIDTFELLCESR